MASSISTPDFAACCCSTICSYSFVPGVQPLWPAPIVQSTEWLAHPEIRMLVSINSSGARRIPAPSVGGLFHLKQIANSARCLTSVGNVLQSGHGQLRYIDYDLVGLAEIARRFRWVGASTSVY